MTTIILSLLKNIALSMIGKIAFEEIGERFATNLAVHGLRKLSRMTTNTVDDELVEDIINSLKGRKLKEIGE